MLVLETGPFALPEHAQNMPFMGDGLDMRLPWANHPALNTPAFCSRSEGAR
jgi:hypothetical protein